MRTILNAIHSRAVQDFAEEHDLTMVINERPPDLGVGARYYAEFDATEVSYGHFLTSTYGNGNTPEQAVTNYCHKLSQAADKGHALVIRNKGKNTKRVPLCRLTFNGILEIG